ncbi:MAG: hypothetical protein GZ091_00445 [Paludibacter sp.]|nr:hypothetical protein [Paludibacter sp.]
MNKSSSILLRCKPGISKRYLLFVAAIMWTFAGGMLLVRGCSFLLVNNYFLSLKAIVSLLAGFVFYFALFSGVSSKHINRIVSLTVEKPCFFSFFGWKSYFMMFIMISFGITLRKSGFIPLEYLSFFYITMGIPLFLSALRFYFYGFNFKNAEKGIKMN